MIISTATTSVGNSARPMFSPMKGSHHGRTIDGSQKTTVYLRIDEFQAEQEKGHGAFG